MLRRSRRFLGLVATLWGVAFCNLGADETPWSLRPLERPEIPSLVEWGATPIDAFIIHRLEEEGMAPAKPAARRTLIRRLYVNLLGLPPTPEAVEAFLQDDRPDAYERLVDDLLASPRYGERWARHWMDAVRYAETHGHDEDAIREHAWPYRDYLVRAFNRDIPYARFVSDQIAGDVLHPNDPDSVVATGFLSCGPWDESSQMGIQDGTIDKEIARMLDRDDMITAAFSTFTSTTVHCARCHDHKADPIPQEDYYSLQAVFSGIDRVNRPYPADTRGERERLEAERDNLAKGIIATQPDLDTIEQWEKSASITAWSTFRPSKLHAKSELTELPDLSIRSGGERPETDTYVIASTGIDATIRSLQLELLTDQALPMKGPGRQDNGNLHLSQVEIEVDGRPRAIATAEADFNQGGWTVAHAIDDNPKSAWGIFPQVGMPHSAAFRLAEPIHLRPEQTLVVKLHQLHGGGHLIGRFRLAHSPQIDAKLRTKPIAPELEAVAKTPREERTAEQTALLNLAILKEQNQAAIDALPQPPTFYGVASNFNAIGNFKPAMKPRAVFVLNRGDIRSPGRPAVPGALSSLPLPARFPLPDGHDEGARRAALAGWLAHRDNVLVWRSIANRVWQHHFGRGIVATPNDFGAMGGAPSHPELLDWLACELGDSGGSIKALHRLIVTSSVYRQSSRGDVDNEKLDAENRLLWRMNPRRLDAETIRDAVLQMSDRIDLTMHGPSARQFHSSKGVHVTPVLNYHGFDPDDPANSRRAVYRFVFRTVPDPLMQALDCPDASQLAPVRTSASTPLQALAMLNNRFLIRQGEHLAARLERDCETPSERVEQLFALAYARPPTSEEAAEVAAYAGAHGLANACRVITNSNEFLFVP